MRFSKREMGNEKLDKLKKATGWNGDTCDLSLFNMQKRLNAKLRYQSSFQHKGMTKQIMATRNETFHSQPNDGLKGNELMASN